MMAATTSASELVCDAGVLAVFVVRVFVAVGFFFLRFSSFVRRNKASGCTSIDESSEFLLVDVGRVRGSDDSEAGR